MRKEFVIDKKYMNIPIMPTDDKALVAFYQTDSDQEEKVMEFEIPIIVDEEEEVEKDYEFKYFTQLPVSDYMGKVLSIQGEMPENFVDAIYFTDEPNEHAKTEKRPAIHFTADTGWTNDPNGLVYHNGIYHLYYQYNPFDLEWKNMSWGHAVSKDLIHWEQKDAVMFPDKDGMIYSGCAIVNERELLGLPKDAIIFFYTAAGGVDEWSKDLQFTQKIAYSLDGGETLVKMDPPCVPTIYRDSRDPKVFWHEESQAYVMVLWTKANDFGILRSENLKDWTLVEEITLEDGWECPDLFQLKSEDGETCWFFWSADGYYYIGEFDGYHFETDGMKHRAYLSSIPYAAQTYSGVDKTISVPWLRIKNDGRCFTGSYGIPVEFSCKKTEKGWTLLQKPVKALMENAHEFTDMIEPSCLNIVHINDTHFKNALMIHVKMKQDDTASLHWRFNGSSIRYIPDAGRMLIDNKAYRVYKNQKELMFIIDDQILEVFFVEEGQLGTFELRDATASLDLNISEVESYHIFEID